MPSTHTFERVFLRALRQIYDTERQLSSSLPSLCTPAVDQELVLALREIEAQSERQTERLAGIFRSLYLEPRSEACWVTTALLREALDAASGHGASSQGNGSGTEGCAAALLALKRYELTLYEALLRWSERCDLYEALPAIRRSIAEELLQASILAEFAFDPDRGAKAPITVAERRALH
jgi:ferritin-like metal-binding protein YciE